MKIFKSNGFYQGFLLFLGIFDLYKYIYIYNKKINSMKYGKLKIKKKY